MLQRHFPTSGEGFKIANPGRPACLHTIFHTKCKHCLALQETYYAKLREIDPSWIDIEDTKHPERPLISWHNFRFSQNTPDKMSDVGDYYQSARSLLHTHKFKNDAHKLIWELHAQGLSKRKIEKAIAGSPKPYKRESISTIIKVIAAFLNQEQETA